MNQPFADFLRPETLDEVVGQEHLIGKDGLIRKLIERQDSLPNMIFYGPSGTGKTTIANIIAKQTKRKLYCLNATTASTSEIKDIINNLDTLIAPNGVLLYLDEIQYFSKKQQQSLLESIENGKIVLIASTTENPYFYIYNAILSRSIIFEFKSINNESIIKALNRAIPIIEKSKQCIIKVDNNTLETLAAFAHGDCRKAINLFELLFNTATFKDNTYTLTENDVEAALSFNSMHFDKDGDQHYDTLSAFQKSIRGSDPDAAIYYLAILLNADQMISVCRRLLVIAAEDIGLAYPNALPIVKAAVDSAFQLGLPEARIPLAEATIFLATCPKSNSTISAIDDALKDIQEGRTGPIPSHLLDSHYQGSKALNHGTNYLYPHSYPNHYVKQQYLPTEISYRQYYFYQDNKYENSLKNYWSTIKNSKK